MHQTSSISSSPLVQSIARGLLQARRSETAWAPAHFDESLTTDDAYQVQDAVAAELGWFANGRVPAWKAGGKGTMSGAPLPLVLTSGSTWRPAATHDYKMEAEVAFRLGRAPADADDVLASIATMCVSIEVIGTRLAGGMAAPAAWKLADQGLHGVLVAGEEVAFEPRDWSTQGFKVRINGAVEADSKGTHPNGDAPLPLRWLVDHARSRKRALQAGDLVTTGAWVVIRIAPGDLVEVEFPGIGKAAVKVEGEA